MTLFKFSLRNARRQARDYLVYFITIVLSAALIYAFNSLVFSQEIRKLSTMMDSLPLVVTLASIVIVCIIGWLVSYTINFILRKRSRELGTYILIGLENSQVARLFFLENLAVGAAAFVLGTLLGNVIFQALRAVTLSLFQKTYTFGFAFSIQAILLSLVYFAMIYLLALIRNHRSISKMKICNLINLDRQNEGEVIHREKARRKIFTLSIVLGIIGTGLLLTRSLFTGLLGAALIIIFLYGFFISFSSGVPAYFNKRPEKKYHGCTLLVFRTLTAKLATMGVVMATIALLFTGTLIAEGSGMVFNALFQSRAAQTTCFDLYIGSADSAQGPLDNYISYINAEIPVKQSWSYDVYIGDNANVTDYITKNIDRYYQMFDKDILMKASDYTALRAMLGYAPAEPVSGEYLIHCMPYLKKLLSTYSQPLEINGGKLAAGEIYSEDFTQSLWDGNGYGFILVVPDGILENQTVSHRSFAAITSQPVIGDTLEQLHRYREEKDSSIHGYDTIFSKAALEEENASMYALIVFPLYYVALVLTMVAATILTIHQLSETSRLRRQFQLLRKLGMDQREMERSLRNQFAIFYAMPAVPPVLIGIPFIAALGSTLDAGVLYGPGQVAAIAAISLCLFLAIYFVYILAAYTSLKRSVLSK